MLPLSTYVVFVFLSGAALASSIFCFLIALSTLRKYGMRWLKLAFPLLIAGLIGYDWWNRPSEALRGLSVFMSVVILSFSMLISFKLTHILGLEQARSLKRTPRARRKFDPKIPVTSLGRVVASFGGAALAAAFSLPLFLPAPYPAPVTVAGVVIVLLTFAWRFGSQASKISLDIRFRQDLRCLLIFCLTFCGLVSLVLFWWIFGMLAIRLEMAFVLSSALCASFVLALLGLLRIPRQFGGASQDRHRIAFLTAYQDFEKLMAASLLVFIFVFSDVPVILFLSLTETTTYVPVWAMGVVGLLVSLVKSYTFQRTSLMIESNRISRTQVNAAIVRLATSYLAS